MMQLFPMSSMYCSPIAHGRLKVCCFGHMTSWSGGGKQWTAEEFREIQNGGLLLRFPFDCGSPLTVNFPDYNGNVYTWSYLVPPSV